MGIGAGFKGVLKAAYPMISLAAGLGGPIGTMAAASVAKALGLNDVVEPTHAGIEAAITQAQVADPEALLKMKEAENDFILKCKASNIDLEKIAAADTSSARTMHMTLRDWTPQILTYALVGGSLVISVVVLLHKVAVDSAMAGVILGYIFSESKQAVGFWLGSSAGSKGKDDAISEALAQKSGA